MGALETLTKQFSLNILYQFFSNEITSFKSDEVDFDFLFEEDGKIQKSFAEIRKLGEADLPNGEDLLVFTAHTIFSLTDRSGKKQQYEIAKKILKEEVSDAAFFIFYDDRGQFRFSFIRADFKGTKREFTTFKRYTYFVSPSQTNQTFIRQLSACSFQDLEEIQEAFSVEPLNKEFYQKIAKAFYGLIGGKVVEGSKAKEYIASLQLPSLDSIKNHRTYQEFAVRFIGRTIFIWFLKNKSSDAGLPLIPSDWLTSTKVASTKEYYHSLLEKLFFEILNTPINERISSLPPEHTIIPFLNGGLFEPQHDDFYEAGFNDFSKYHNTLKLPDCWIQDLFETLEQFNFTIDENTLTDMEVSIDPEMLGTIFENLLAEIDPGTEKSARKSTGSFYTPREIVDYMVVESLVANLHTKTSINEALLHTLFGDGDLNPGLVDQRSALIDAFDEVKILDPACGSGAFPMGALHKINLALQKLDPEAKVWKEKQLSKIENVAYRNALKDKLDKSNVDYVRKIGIIQHSIYGVDIQPIATEISKLRSFLSLVVDENIDDTESNRGIYPLPNLEFKFVTANTLIGLSKQSIASATQIGVGFDFSGVSNDLNELQATRDKYLQSFGEEKESLKNDFIMIQKRIAKKEYSSKAGGNNPTAQQIISWNPFAHESSGWFNPRWMFGVNQFDIVIGNPPYIQLSKQNDPEYDYKQKLKKEFGTSGGRLNTFIFFIHQGMNLAKDGGAITYIVPNTILTQEYYAYTREFILKNTKIKKIVNYEGLPFENAVVENVTLILEKGKLEHYDIEIVIDNLKSPKSIGLKNRDQFLSEYKYNFNTRFNGIVDKILGVRHTQLGDLCNINQAIALKGDKSLSLHSANKNGEYYKLLDGRNINKYSITWSGVYFDFNISRIHSCKRKDIFQAKEKLLFRRVSSKLIFAYDADQYFALNTLVVITAKNNINSNLKYLLAILNSKLMDYLYINKYKSTKTVFSEIQARTIGRLPIIVNQEAELKITEIVEQILMNKRKGRSTDAAEKEIDLIIYKLYNMSYHDVQEIDVEIDISEDEYEKFKYE
jgi:adenine-specific DNA-methyltransferase